MLGRLLRSTTISVAAILVAAVALLGQPDSARSQVTFVCAPIADTDPGLDGKSRIANPSTGTCIDGSTTLVADFDGTTPADADIRVGIFNDGVNTSIRIEHGDDISNVIAPGFTGTDPGVRTDPTNSEVSIFIQFDFAGETFNFPVFKQGTTSTINGFQSQLVNPPVDTTESDNLDSQQASLSVLVINSHLNVLGDVVFDKLSDVFKPGSGTQISANGFSTSTSGVANWIDQKQQQKLQRQLADLPRDENGDQIYVTAVADFAAPQVRKWDAWIKGTWTVYEGDNSSFDGHTINFLAGADYRANNSVVIGVLGGYGNSDFDTVLGGLDGGFEADGYTIGTYIGVKPNDHLQFDALAAYTYSDYANKSGATDGTFTAQRVTVGAQLKGIFESGGVFFEPSARILYANEQQDKYTDTAGFLHSSDTVTAGRASIGPKMGYVHRSDEGGLFRAWLAVKGEYEFSSDGNTPTAALPDFGNDYSGRVSLGIDAAHGEGFSISLQGDVSGLGTATFIRGIDGADYLAYGGSARIDVRF